MSQQQQEGGEARFSIETSHNDLIHDVRYNYYGDKLATCSSDQTVKVFEQNAESGQWQQTAEWKAHDASVWKVDWAPPEFGDVLATCSYDRTVMIWEKSSLKQGDFDRWERRARLVDSRQSVSDIAFAPKHLGLQLATCSSDGSIRIYEAVDVMNLNHWSLVDEFEFRTGKSGAKHPVNCLSWNPSAFGPRCIAVGGHGKNFEIFRYQEAVRKWTGILDDASDARHKGPVLDISWAPNLGRSYDILATASKDKTVKIWKLVLDAADKKGIVRQVAVIRDHKSEVWHCEWNVTGTVLATSGDDGVVRLWKQAVFSKENEWAWEQVSVISGK